jgi:exopolyphosphatase/guanosine-5'-triphosphate,3'-diphosphate pyrophosphatase
MARIYQYQPDHAAHVRMLCQRLFADLKALHQYGTDELELLESAALLHDLGTIINYNDHHKHSQMLIISSGLAGYTSRETTIISLLARYHRKGTPSWEGFESLMQEGDDTLLVRLAAILRMAEYLERGRSGIVSDVEADWDDETVTITLLSDRTPAVELWDAERNAAPLFETAFGRTVHLQLGHSTQG